MQCRFVMPFRSDAEITIRNLNKMAVPIKLVAATAPYDFDRSAYHFHSQWNAEHKPPRPFRDMGILEAKGEGKWVGMNMHVANPVTGWWGEGDEKVWVDGEGFPSTFGTGTEDYFGYAWCSSTLFAKPYHGQSTSDEPANFGNTNVHRWQVFDDIPFSRSISFNLEAWAWDDKAEPTYAYTAYWYAAPGSEGPRAIDTSMLNAPNLVPPGWMEGLLRGESLHASATGGTAKVENHAWQAVGMKQLLWSGESPGDILTIEVPVKEAGRYAVRARMAGGPDYGIFHMAFNGQEVAVLDFEADKTEFHTTQLGVFDLPAGTTKLQVLLVAKGYKSSGYNFGLDYIGLKKM
jgi:hypothetical protein